MPMWVRQGLKAHDKEHSLVKNRVFRRFDLYPRKYIHDMEVHSETLHFHGVIDTCIFCEDEIIPVEFKLRSSDKQKGHKAQIVLYSIILRESFTLPINRYLIYSKDAKKTVLYMLDDEQAEETLKLAEKVKSVCLDVDMLPQSSAKSSKCERCEYYLYCNDRDI
jgi:CRISPR-associated protein Cas4